MESIDDILNQLQAEYKNKEEAELLPNSEAKLQADELLKFEGLDNLLNEVKQELSQHQEVKLEVNSQEDDLLLQIEAKFNQKKAENSDSVNQDIFNDYLQVSKQKTTNIDNLVNNLETKFAQEKQQKFLQYNHASQETNNLLQELQLEYQQQKKVELEQLEKSKLELIQQQELDKQRRRKALVKKAEVWLKNLDPYSDEGLWFEEFAYGYASKLEAAIEYLEALMPPEK